jgi:hypothetical protein
LSPIFKSKKIKHPIEGAINARKSDASSKQYVKEQLSVEVKNFGNNLTSDV